MRGATTRHAAQVLWLASALMLSMPASAVDRFDAVVIDAGHGGDDHGARGRDGLNEKDLVLDVARVLASRLRQRGLRVVMTREDDVFVPLETRMSVANDARADLFVSIHANAASSRQPRGMETYFASPQASDDAARQLARRENDAFGEASAAASPDDSLNALVGALIGDDLMKESDEFAKLARQELAGIDSMPARDVKQAPFVVLMGVRRMPAALVEVGFLTNPEDEKALRDPKRRAAVADALARAVDTFSERFDARRGVTVGLHSAGEAR